MTRDFTIEKYSLLCKHISESNYNNYTVKKILQILSFKDFFNVIMRPF